MTTLFVHEKLYTDGLCLTLLILSRPWQVLRSQGGGSLGLRTGHLLGQLREQDISKEDLANSEYLQKCSRTSWSEVSESFTHYAQLLNSPLQVEAWGYRLPDGQSFWCLDSFQHRSLSYGYRRGAAINAWTYSQAKDWWSASFCKWWMIVCEKNLIFPFSSWFGQEIPALDQAVKGRGNLELLRY